MLRKKKFNIDNMFKLISSKLEKYLLIAKMLLLYLDMVWLLLKLNMLFLK